MPLVMALLFRENMSSPPSYTLCSCCLSVLNVPLYMQNVKTNKECCFVHTEAPQLDLFP